MEVLRIENLKAYYDKAMVLNGINLNVEDGETIAILGPNGAGKTTLLKSIIGLVKTTGRIEFLGRDITSLKPHERIKRGIAICPEGRRLFPYMTVEENLKLAAKTKDYGEDLELVYSLFPEIKRRRNTQARLTSGGEQQMIAIGRALIARPKLLLMDEPSHGIAPIVLLRIKDAMERIQRETGISILLVEQNIRLALELANKVSILIKGEIVESGEADKVKDLEKYYFERI